MPEVDAQLIFIYATVAAGLALGGRWVWKTYVRPASKTGFGRGAPGFQTSVRKEWVKREDLPADHILRRRVIEEVDLRPGASSSSFAGSSPSTPTSSQIPDSSVPDNEWLPTRPQNQRKGSSSSRRKR